MADKLSRPEQILKLAQASPGISTAEAAAILGMSAGNLGTYLSALRKQGKLKKTRGTLELADGADAKAEPGASSPEPDDLPSPDPGDDAPKQLRVTKKVQQQLRRMVVEGLARAERYRRDGVLTNILLTAAQDGETQVRGIAGGPALTCFMLGPPDPEALQDPEFRESMRRLVAGVGDGQGQLMVIFNLTELGGEGEPLQALMSAWVGGKRINCATAPLDDEPTISSEGGSRWSDLDEQQAGALSDSEWQRQLELNRERAAEDDGEAGLTLSMLRFLHPEQDSPEQHFQAMGEVMADPERAPALIIEFHEVDGQVVGVGLRRLASEVAPAIAQAAGVDHADGAGMPALLERACANAEALRQAGAAESFIEIGLADGSTMRAGWGQGPLLALMCGTPGHQMGELIASFGEGQGRRAVFVNMLDLASDGVDQVLVSAWEGGELALARIASIDHQPLDEDSPAWRAVDGEQLQRLGSAGLEAYQAEKEPEDAPEDEPDQEEPDQDEPSNIQNFFAATHQLVRDSIKELDDQHSLFVMAVLDEQGRVDLPLWSDGQGLGILNVEGSHAIFGVGADQQGHYTVAGWAERRDQDGERMVVLVGAGPAGPPQVLTYFDCANGQEREEQLLIAMPLLGQLTSAMELGEQPLDFPEDEEAREHLAAQAQAALLEAERDGDENPTFLCLRADGKGTAQGMAALTEDNRCTLLYWELPKTLMKLGARSVSWVDPEAPDGATAKAWAVSADAGLCLDPVSQTLQPAGGVLAHVVAKVLKHNGFVAEVRAGIDARKWHGG